jgi:hypothetical protein
VGVVHLPKAIHRHTFQIVATTVRGRVVGVVVVVLVGVVAVAVAVVVVVSVVVGLQFLYCVCLDVFLPLRTHRVSFGACVHLSDHHTLSPTTADASIDRARMGTHATAV